MRRLENLWTSGPGGKAVIITIVGGLFACASCAMCSAAASTLPDATPTLFVFPTTEVPTLIVLPTFQLPIETNTATLTPTNEATVTNTPTDQPTNTATNTSSPTNTVTYTPTYTATATSTPTKTIPPTNTQWPTKAPLSGPICDCSSNIYNCDDFPLDNGATAKQCFQYCKDQGAGDIHDLDRDNDNNACESTW